MNTVFKLGSLIALVPLGALPLCASKPEPRVLPAAESSLPPVGAVLQKALKRADYEDQNDGGFKEHYAYSRRKVKEERNGQGKLKKRDQKVNQYFPQRTTSPAPQPVSAKVTAGSDLPKKAITKEDFPLDAEMLSRFQCAMVGRQIVRGRPTLVLDFKPADRNLPVRNLKDHFLKKAAGRLWIDENDWVVEQADLHLTGGVNIVGGLAASVHGLRYHLERERTPDGYWFTKAVNWHVEAREFLVQKILDYAEERFDVRKVR